MLGDIINAETFASGVRLATPLALGALGGVFSERPGVVNIALEGIMLTGAFTAIAVTNFTHNPWLGILGAILAGVLIALVHAISCVTFKANQIVSGVAINIFGSGITVFFSWLLFNGTQIMALERLPIWKIPTSESTPHFLKVLVTLFGNYSPLVYIALLIILVSHLVIYKTPFGLRLRAVGEHPQAADTLGISVDKMRYIGVMLSGALAGLGGAFLSLEVAHYFVKEMTGGRGFISLAAMIFGKWTPLGAAGAALFFGLAEALAIRLQAYNIPVQFVNMLPFLLTMFVLVSAVGRAVPPAADGIPYEKEGG